MALIFTKMLYRSIPDYIKTIRMIMKIPDRSQNNNSVIQTMNGKLYYHMMVNALSVGVILHYRV